VIDGVKLVISMISNKEEVVRVYCLKVVGGFSSSFSLVDPFFFFSHGFLFPLQVATILRKVSSKKRSKVIKELDSGGFFLMQENLCKEPISSIIYSSLFELVTGTVRRQSMQPVLRPCSSPPLAQLSLIKFLHFLSFLFRGGGNLHLWEGEDSVS